jgi:hypothetical protein
LPLWPQAAPTDLPPIIFVDPSKNQEVSQISPAKCRHVRDR